MNKKELEQNKKKQTLEYMFDMEKGFFGTLMAQVMVLASYGDDIFLEWIKKRGILEENVSVKINCPTDLKFAIDQMIQCIKNNNNSSSSSLHIQMNMKYYSLFHEIYPINGKEKINYKGIPIDFFDDVDTCSDFLHVFLNGKNYEYNDNPYFVAIKQEEDNNFLLGFTIIDIGILNPHKAEWRKIIK